MAKDAKNVKGKKGVLCRLFSGASGTGGAEILSFENMDGKVFFLYCCVDPLLLACATGAPAPCGAGFFQERSWIASFLLLMASTAIMPCWKAVTMLLEAARESFDKAFLFSGDSDMIAGVKALKNLAPHIHVKAIIPFGRSSIDLANNCHSQAKIKRSHLEKNQLPREIPLGGGKTLTKPQEWA